MKERKHAAYWGGIGSWRLKGNTYQYWSLCNKIISIGGAHG